MKERHGYTFGFKVTGSDLCAHLDQVMAELVRLEAEDASIGVDTSRQYVEVEVSTEADSARQAFEYLISLIRTAVHAAGGTTPDWFAGVQAPTNAGPETSPFGWEQQLVSSNCG